MKYLIGVYLLGVFLALSAVAGPAAAADCGGKNKTHNFFFGSRSYNDRMVFMANPKHDGTFLKKYSEDVTYPLPGHYPEGRITYIEVMDQYRDGKGGCAYLKNGGVGQDHVTLHVKSGYRGGGYNFVVKVYTRY